MDLGNGGDCIKAIPNDVLKNLHYVKKMSVEKHGIIGNSNVDVEATSKAGVEAIAKMSHHAMDVLEKAQKVRKSVQYESNWKS